MLTTSEVIDQIAKNLKEKRDSDYLTGVAFSILDVKLKVVGLTLNGEANFEIVSPDEEYSPNRSFISFID